MKVLIVGGHGFVGRRTAAKLNEPGIELVIRSRRDGLDLTDLDCAKEQLAQIKPDAIINCAAHVGSLHYVSKFAADVFGDNVSMALNLYKAVHDVCPDTRIVNPLSNCSYPGDADVQTEDEWWNGEVHKSVCSYGNAKRFIYVTSQCYALQYGQKTVNILVPNTFGPGDYTDPNRTHALNGMIIRMLQAHKQGQPEFEIWGTGAPVREWGYIDDVAEILKLGLTVEQDLIYPVNMAQNHGYSIKESAEKIAEAIGYGGMLVFNANYQDGAPRKVLDDKRFRVLFPDFKFTDHTEGIYNTVRYYETVLEGEIL
jgi:GDP-L-fucose synthase